MIFIKDYDNDGEDCYILEVDLTFPKELHDKHNDYPSAPELTYVKANSLSPYQVELQKRTHQSLPKNANSLTHKQINEYIQSHPFNPRDEKSPGLVANLNDKEKYVLHMDNLKEYLKMGLKLKQIHRVIKCKMILKRIYKPMNNVVFGKTMENVEKHVEYELVVNKKGQ